MAGSITPVQSTTGNGVATTLVLTLTGVAAGHMLTLQASWFNSNATTAPSVPTDTNGTWAVAENPAGVSDAGGNFIGTSIFYLKNAAAGTHVVTFTNHGVTNTTQYASLAEWAGASLTAPLDTATPNNATATFTAQTVAVATAGAVSNGDELILACMGVTSGAGQANALISTPSGFTQLEYGGNTATDIGAEQCYKSASGLSGVQTTTWTWTDSTTRQAVACVASFIPAPAAHNVSNTNCGI